MAHYVDNDAKLRVLLHRLTDEYNNDYFIGKLQFPGKLDFETGASFMVFVAANGEEELQIGPIDENRRSNRIRNASSASMKASNKIRIDMHPCTDSAQQIFYVGEAECPASIDCRDGIFFTFFCSKEGKEELQLGRLKPKRKQNDKPRYQVENDYDSTGTDR